MLSSTDRPIVHIAEMTGFRTASHLSNLFKQRFKVSPTAWRQAKGHGSRGDLTPSL